MNEKESNWFIVRTRSRAEKKVAVVLKSEGWDAYCPTYFTMKQWSDRIKKVELPLISGTVFVRCCDKSVEEIYDNPLVVHIMKEFQKLAIVRESEINNLKILCDQWDDSVITAADNLVFKQGDLIKVVNGSFSGLQGQMTKLKGKHKLIITIKALNKSFIVEIPKSMVQLAVH
jgi:transcription antitermination factor NusG